ncbi:transcription initiation factor TFIID subunit 1-like [Condylostylus longicornis]|uniref:transcription initiation factor TFIID subunit 1-like n=1 Tax=Condylostylus longicornis TaxID=2530218 RepID=UPI00244DC613|nr:transcription initiation factor TFIID subunit 1-like [Condylostylus longicornis]
MDLPKDFHYMLYRAPSIRYHDTSFIINKKWQRAGEELTFPTVHSFVNSDAKFRDYMPDTPNTKSKNVEHYMTDSETDKVNRNRHQRNRPRRRTRSLEKHSKRPLSAALEIRTSEDEREGDDGDTFNLDVQSVKSVIEKKLDGKECQTNVPNIAVNVDGANKTENLYCANGAIKIDKSKSRATSNNTSNDKNNNNKTTIIVSYQTITSTEDLNLIDNNKSNEISKIKFESEKNSHSFQPVNTYNKKTFSDLENRRSKSPSIASTVLATMDESQQKSSQNIVIADVHPRPISTASSTVSGDPLVIKENSSEDGDNEGYNLTKEIQQVPEFFKHRGSKSLITIQESEIVNPLDGSVSDQEDINKQRTRVSSNASDYDSDRTLISENSSKNIKTMPFDDRRYFYAPSCTSPSWLSISTSTINDADVDYPMSDYEIVDLRRRNSSTILKSLKGSR